VVKITLEYCGTSDVKRILQNKFAFSASTSPTDTEVAETIEDVQDEIDQITQHAWREKTVTNEFYNFPIEFPGHRYYLDPGIPIYLRHRNIMEMSTATGDKIELWDGGTAYTDYVATKTQNRNNDFWVDHEKGIIYLKIFFPFYIEKAARITYRYGGSATPPKDIRRAASYMAAIELIENDDKSDLLNDTGINQLEYSTKLERMQKKVDKILKNRTEILTI